MTLSREQIKRLAKEVYAKIRGRVWCPVFNDYVNFGSRGSRHVTHKRRGGKRVLRQDGDTLRRIRLLPDTPGIVTDPTTKVTPKPSKGKDKMWRLDKQIKNKIITVMVVQRGDGLKQYLSVADDDIKLV